MARRTPNRTSRPLTLVAVVVIVSSVGFQPARVSALTAGSAPVPIMGANPFGYRGLERYDDTHLCTTPTTYGLEKCQTPETTASLQAQALALVKRIPGRADGKSLAGLGYNILQLDNTWQGPRVCPPPGGCDLTTTGDLTANPNNFTSFAAYPNCTPGADCFHDLVTWIKSQCDPVLPSKCLKVGIYSDWGQDIGCNHALYTDTYNGLYNHEAADAATFHAWGVNYVKIDSICGDAPNGARQEWANIRDAFAAYDNLVPPNPLVADFYWGAIQVGYGVNDTYSNFWRLYGDMCGCFSVSPDPNAKTISSTLDQLDASDSSVNASGVSAPNVIGSTNGQWDDMDNLLVTGTNGYGGMTYNYLSPLDQRTQFGLEALNASMLEIGSDVRNVVGCDSTQDSSCSPSANWPAPNATAVTDFVANDQVVSVDQDSLGDMSRVVACDHTYPCSQSNGYGNWEIRSKLLNQFGTRAVGLLNRSNTSLPISGNNVTIFFNRLRKDGEKETDGTQPVGGLHNVTHVYDMWNHAMPDLVNSSGTITLGTGLPQVCDSNGCTPADTAYTIHYTCTTTYCRFGDAANQLIPPHALILLEIVGTSD